MTEEMFDRIADAFAREGASAAIDRLVGELRRTGDFHRLFEALTVRARQDLGLPLLARPTSSTLPLDQRSALEDRMIAACREVGGLFLARGDIAEGYQYLQMIGELDAVREAIGECKPTEEEIGPLIEIALSRGVHPVRGVELVLTQYGLCQAISACESLLASGNVSIDDQRTAVALILGAVHRELRDRLADEIARRDGQPPTDGTISDWVAKRSWLFDEDNYHIDTSHLSAVVRMARMVGPSTDLHRAIELCDYGCRLSSRYRYPDPAPFEDVYRDSRRYFQILAGLEVETELAYFRRRAEECDPSAVGSFPIETYLQILRTIGRPAEAISFAESWASEAGVPSTASLATLCAEAGDFDAMARLARRRQDPITFLAALVQRTVDPPPPG